MTDVYACTIEESASERCVVCPEVPYIPAVPASSTSDRLLGWNASAISRRRIEGNAFVQFGLSGMGALTGLVNARAGHDPRTVGHGIYAYLSGGSRWWVVLEAGAAKTAPVAHAVDDVFRIERRGSAVTYFCNGRQVYSSAVALPGSVIVQGCLYAAEDLVQ